MALKAGVQMGPIVGLYPDFGNGLNFRQPIIFTLWPEIGPFRAFLGITWMHKDIGSYSSVKVGISLLFNCPNQL